MSLVEAGQTEIDVPLPPPPRAEPATIALFLDVDGTLVDFAARPDSVVVDAALRPVLRKLAVQLGGALAAISGRPLHEIDALLDLPTAAAAGLHGAQLRAADGRILAAPHDHSPLQVARLRAALLAAAHPGVLVEDKGSAIALHYRMAPIAETAVRRAAVEMLQATGPGYELLQGNRVVELKPAETNKGTALSALMQTQPFAGRTPWVIGDDLTDEDAFQRANVLGGVSVIVGPRRPTLAHYALTNPAAARAWLASLLENEVTA